VGEGEVRQQRNGSVRWVAREAYKSQDKPVSVLGYDTATSEREGGGIAGCAERTAGCHSGQGG